MTSITVKAPAKVNLFLKVLSKRKDSYHNLHTLFERVALYDTIRITKISKGVIVKSDKAVTKNPKDNLVYKAARVVLLHAGIKSGVKIEIKKRIPIAAGLGGGSSDAASTILGIDKLFGLKLKRDALMRLGSSIGADVPFFLLDARFAVGRGIGGNLDIIESGRDLWHLLVFPGFKLETKGVYKAFDRIKAGKSNRLTCKMSDVKIVSSLTGHGDIEAMLCNDLERAAISQERVIGGILKSLGQLLGRRFIVSGSGPSLFCLYGTGKEAIAGKRTILTGLPAGDIKGWRIFAVKTA